MLYRASTVDVKHNEDEGSKNSCESAEKVRVGNEEESFEFVVFVGTNGHSFGLFDEVISWFLVVDLVLIYSFLLRGLNKSRLT